MWLLHGARRRRAARRVRHADRTRRRTRGDDDRRARRRGPRACSRPFRRHRRLAMWVLHAGHRHALRGRTRPGRRPFAGGAPVPVHRLADGARRAHPGHRARSHAGSRRPRAGARRSRPVARNASISPCRSAAGRSRTTPHRATRWLRCPGRRDRTRKPSGRPGSTGSWRSRCWRRASRAGKVQGRRTTVDAAAPLLDRMPPCPAGGVQLATQWVEPAYLEPDASWCEPGGEPASPLANAGAFGAKTHSAAPAAARELADHFGRAVRVVYAREDVVRLGPKRPPIAAVAVARGGIVEIDGVLVRGAGVPRIWPTAAGVEVRARWTEVEVPGPPVSSDLRAVGLAEQAVLVAGALGRDVDVVTPTGARARRAGRGRGRQGHGRRRGARGRRSARRGRVAFVRHRCRPHGAGLGHERGPRGRPRPPARSTISRSARSACCDRPRRRPSR